MLHLGAIISSINGAHLVYRSIIIGEGGLANIPIRRREGSGGCSVEELLIVYSP